MIPYVAHNDTREIFSQKEKLLCSLKDYMGNLKSGKTRQNVECTVEFGTKAHLCG